MLDLLVYAAMALHEVTKEKPNYNSGNTRTCAHCEGRGRCGYQYCCSDQRSSCACSTCGGRGFHVIPA
jgi:hypothetical protein